MKPPPHAVVSFAANEYTSGGTAVSPGSTETARDTESAASRTVCETIFSYSRLVWKGVYLSFCDFGQLRGQARGRPRRRAPGRVFVLCGDG